MTAAASRYNDLVAQLVKGLGESASDTRSPPVMKMVLPESFMGRVLCCFE